MLAKLGGPTLTAVALIASSVSIVALLLHIAGWLPMYFLIQALGAPSLALLFIVGVAAHRVGARIVTNRLLTGAWTGIVATCTYDVFRFLLVRGGALTYDPFKSHPVFGTLITGAPPHTPIATVVGWAYHFWNGFGFGIMYALVAGPARWYYALAWAMVLELAWLTAMPSFLQLRLSPEVVTVSLSGHAMYGVVLGLLCRRFVEA